MGKVPDVKRINKEDFDGPMQDTIDQLAFPINSFMEQTRNALDRSLDFTNLNQEVIVLTITPDINGIPVTDTQYKSNLKTRVLGHICINASNLTNTLNTVLSTPFISFVQNEKLVKINKVSGLQPNQKYTLTLISIGK